MEVAAMRKATTKSRPRDGDRTLSLEEIEAAFMSAGLERDYRTLVGILGEAALAETMTQRWLDLTIWDLLASEGASERTGGGARGAT
jgi:hypothetical protein